MIVYGRNSVREALRGRRAHQVSGVWATTSAAGEPWLRNERVAVNSTEEIERRCGSSAHQGVCAEAGGYPYVGADELLAVESPLIVALDQVQDPQNLGSICRTAECAGASGVVIPERRSAEITPAVCKASAGAVEHIRIARVRNITSFLAEARSAGCWSYGASAPTRGVDGAVDSCRSIPAARAGDGAANGDGDGEMDDGDTGRRGSGQRSRIERAVPIVPYTAPDYSGGVVLVLGSEGHGLRPRVAGACDQLISLPLRGRIDSLGVAAAAAALLYGILWDRDDGLDKAP